jgi:hypothetical protein
MGIMRISISGHIHLHVSVIVDRTTSEDFITVLHFEDPVALALRMKKWAPVGARYSTIE